MTRTVERVGAYICVLFAVAGLLMIAVMFVSHTLGGLTQLEFLSYTFMALLMVVVSLAVALAVKPSPQKKCEECLWQGPFY